MTTPLPTPVATTRNATVLPVALSVLVALLLALAGPFLLRGVEPGLSFSFYANEQPAGITEQYSDAGIISDRKDELASLHEEGWKVSSFWRDSWQYLIGSSGDFAEVRSPFLYRFVPTGIAFAINQLFGGGPTTLLLAWQVMNVLAVALTAGVVTFLGIRLFHAPATIAIATPAVMVASIPVVHTTGFVSVDPLSMLWVAGIALALYMRSWWLFILTAVAGTLTKEVLAIAALPWLLMTIRHAKADRRLWPAVGGVVTALTPIVTFLAIRAALGSSAVEVNFGFNPLAGEFPSYWQRFTSVTGIIAFGLAVFFAFTVLWVGIFGTRRPLWLRDFSWSLLLGLVISIALLSGRVTRTMAPMGPLLALGMMPLLQLLDRRTRTPHTNHGTTDGTADGTTDGDTDASELSAATQAGNTENNASR